MRVEIQNLKRVTTAMREIARRSMDLSPVMQPAASAMIRLIGDSFDRSEDPVSGKKWQALSESTVERRRKGRGGARSNKPLIDTGGLRASAAAKAEADAVAFGMQMPARAYGMAHQFGVNEVRTSKPRTPGRAPKSFTFVLPRRPFLPVDGAGRVDFSSGRARVYAARVARWVNDYVLRGARPR